MARLEHANEDWKTSSRKQLGLQATQDWHFCPWKIWFRARTFPNFHMSYYMADETANDRSENNIQPKRSYFSELLKRILS